MDSNDLSRAVNRQGYRPFGFAHQFFRTGNNFLISSAIDHHTVHNSFFLTKNKGSTGLVRERHFEQSSYKGKVLKKSIFLDNVFVCCGDNLSAGCLVKKGYEIKLSKNDSFVSKNGQKKLTIQFLDSFWLADVNPSQPEGFIKDITAKSTKDIIRILESDHAKALKKAGIKKFGKKNEIWYYLNQRPQLEERKLKIGRQAKLRGENIAWVLNSSCCVHTINDKKHLTNLRSYKDSLGHTQWLGDYKLGNFLLKNVNYCRLDLSDFLSLSKLAEEGFEIYLTNENATISKDGEVCLTAPMIGKYWILNSLHEQNGSFETGCPYEKQNMLSFESKYGDNFTREEIKTACDELTHECKLEGPAKPSTSASHKI